MSRNSNFFLIVQINKSVCVFTLLLEIKAFIVCFDMDFGYHVKEIRNILARNMQMAINPWIISTLKINILRLQFIKGRGQANENKL